MIRLNMGVAMVIINLSAPAWANQICSDGLTAHIANIGDIQREEREYAACLSRTRAFAFGFEDCAYEFARVKRLQTALEQTATVAALNCGAEKIDAKAEDAPSD